MPLLIQMLWLLVLTLFGAREQVRFSQRPRPAIIHIPPNQGLFGLLATFGIPSMVATGLFFPKLEPSLRRIPRDDTPTWLVTRLGAHDHSHVGLTPLGKLSVGEGILATVNTPEHSALSLMGYLGRWRVCALPRASRENRNLQRVLVAQGSTTD